MHDRDLLLKVANLSFVEGRKNQDIAAILRPGKTITKNTNIHWVQELIEEAGQWLLERHRQLAEQEALDSPERDLAHDLCGKFGLLHARVVAQTDTPLGYVPLSKRYAKAAAAYFEDLCEDAEERNEQLHVAVCGGQGILDMATALRDHVRHNVHYYPAALLGRTTACITHIGPETNATIAWSRSGKLHNHLFYGTVPPYDFQDGFSHRAEPQRQKHDDAKRHILERSRKLAAQYDIAAILENMSTYINAAVAGLGLGCEGSHSGGGRGKGDFITGILKPLGIEPAILAEEGVIGDIAYNVFDAQGKSRPDWKFFLTVGQGSEYAGLEFYRHLVAQRRPVIVMAGMSKMPVLRAAIEAKLLSVLVTDACTAKKLLDS